MLLTAFYQLLYYITIVHYRTMLTQIKIPTSPSPRFQPSLLPKVISGEKIQTRRIGKPYRVGSYYLNEQVEVIAVDGEHAIIKYFDGETRKVPAIPPRVGYQLSAPVAGKNRGRSPIPSEWARYRFTIKEQRCERLQDISDSDSIAEGVEIKSASMRQLTHWRDYTDEGSFCFSARDSFKSLWDSIPGNKGDRSWAHNPMVQVLIFEVQQLIEV